MLTVGCQLCNLCLSDRTSLSVNLDRSIGRLILAPVSSHKWLPNPSSTMYFFVLIIFTRGKCIFFLRQKERFPAPSFYQNKNTFDKKDNIFFTYTIQNTNFCSLHQMTVWIPKPKLHWSVTKTKYIFFSVILQYLVCVFLRIFLFLAKFRFFCFVFFRNVVFFV